MFNFADIISGIFFIEENSKTVNDKQN